MPFTPENRRALNGVDCLMLAFDYQLKKNGFAGNLAQIILGLSGRLEVAAFQKRLLALSHEFPIIRAELKTYPWKGKPYFLIPEIPPTNFSFVHSHELEVRPASPDHAALRRKLLNSPLSVKDQEWLRFDLIYFSDNTMEVIMTWHHILMDAKGAEYFLHLVGGGDGGEACRRSGLAAEAEVPFQKRLNKTDMKARWRLADRAFARIDSMALLRPLSLYTRLKARTVGRLDYCLEEFSQEETERIMESGRKTCGLLNDSAYFMAAALLALVETYHRKGMDTRSYIVSFPVDLRKIGTRLPVFTNQAGTLLYEFKAGEITDLKTVTRLFRSQTHHAVAQDLLFANFCTMDLSRFLPTWFYVRKIKKSLRGEIASMVFANPGATFQGLSDFMGLPVHSQYHVPAVVAPPGLGVVYYFFRGRLQITLVYVEGLLSTEEARGFLGSIRRRLLGGG